VTVYPFIEAEKAGRRNVARACALLKVSRAAFYSHQAGPSQRQREDAELTGQIQAVHEQSKGRYGGPRVHAELRRRGHRHGRKRVARLMRRAAIRGKTPKRWRKTTIPDPAAAARVDRIRRGFTADASKLNARWCGDITYIGTWEGWLYLATVTGIASRRIVGYALADHLRTELVSDALANAVAARNPGPGVIFHSDKVSTPPPPSPRPPATAMSPCPLAGPASAGTTPFPNRSSPHSRASSSICKPGPPRLPPGVRSSSTSPGTTAPGCTAPSDTAAPPNSKNTTRSRRQPDRVISPVRQSGAIPICVWPPTWSGQFLAAPSRQGGCGSCLRRCFRGFGLVRA
jgi:hypothetical protein